VLFVGATAVGASVAWLYEMLTRSTSHIYVNALIAIGFGAVVGAVGMTAVHWGHC